MKIISIPIVAGTLLLGSCAVKETEVAKLAPARAEAVPPPGNYEIGGPLAGVKIKADEPSGYGAGYQYGRDLYPGSVEHSRYYWDKYLPVRSFFDRQSQITNFLAKELVPGGSPLLAQYAEPIYQPVSVNTGKTRAPVEVVRTGVKNPVFKLDLGELNIGMYCVRMIGVVAPIPGPERIPGKVASLVRPPLFVTLKINDGNQGEVSAYRQRCGYQDEFYSLSEIYFHAPAKRHYTAEFFVDDGSQVEVLVHNISLDDALAGTERRAIKTRMTLTSPEEQARIRQLVQRDRNPSAEPKSDPAYYGANTPPFTKEERWKQDELLWKSLPPLNLQPSQAESGGDPVWNPGMTLGTPDKTGAEIVKEFGEWKLKRHHVPLERDPVFAENTTLKLAYSFDDFQARKPFPDPYPYQDDGTGLVWPDAKDPSRGYVWVPLGDLAFEAARGRGGNDTRQWLVTGAEDFARDAAIQLIHHAYDYPAKDDANELCCVVSLRGSYGHEWRFLERRDRQYYPAGIGFMFGDYDKLFEYIQGNQDLADSIRRFIPWVKTPQDLIQLMDTYYVQTVAKEFMRYQIVHSEGATDLPVCAAVLGDNQVTDPWMEWIFARYWVYPGRPNGIVNALINGCDRCGAEDIGSSFYAQYGAMNKAEVMDAYLAAGGNPRYDLSDPKVYPKPLALCDWLINRNVAGQDGLRIGDVTGPDKAVARYLDPAYIGKAARNGWKWSKDPKFAWLLKSLIGRGKETDEEWTKITQSAEKVKRAPWLDLHSRSVENWAAILETGLQHDDFRFRRAVYVRTGVGYGHEHEDALDLQVVAHGLPMTLDGGQRHGYSRPRDDQTRVHNTVEVNGQNHSKYAYAQTIADAEGARYEQVDGVPPGDCKLFRRQVALIDVDEGQGSTPLTIQQQLPSAPSVPGVTTANSYVFDVFRVSGGNLQSYGFHGPANGGVPTVPGSFESNVSGKTPVARTDGNNKGDPDADYLAGFSLAPDSQFAGTAPAALVATWKYLREGMGSEQRMLGGRFDPTSPSKFTRLYLLGLEDARALQADSKTTSASPVQYRWTQLMVQRRANAGNLESAWTAIIEPYAGQPFVQSVNLLAIAANETDAQKAVAVEVKTTNGHTDVCFADGRPEKVRRFPISNHQSQISGEFAYLSTDAQGLRQATLAGGTLLEVPGGITIKVARREYTGKVTAVNYARKALTIDPAWPESAAGRLLEIGQKPGHWTSYASTRLAAAQQGTELTVAAGADFFRSQVLSVVTNADEIRKAMNAGTDLTDAAALVVCADSPSHTVLGRNQQWVASNDGTTKFWRADLRGSSLLLRGPALAENDFAPSGALRLWEYGVGDTVRQSTFVSLRRVQPGEYEVQGDVDAEITIGGKTHRVTTAELAKNGDKVRLKTGD